MKVTDSGIVIWPKRLGSLGNGRLCLCRLGVNSDLTPGKKTVQAADLIPVISRVIEVARLV